MRGNRLVRIARPWDGNWMRKRGSEIELSHNAQRNLAVRGILRIARVEIQVADCW